jgi:hypothetical protein
MAITIREIHGDAELDAVGAFRYQIYVEEMGRAQRYANAIAKRVIEPLDEGARITAAYDDDGRMIGTLRTNYLSDSDIGDYRDFYRIDEFGDPFEAHMTVTTKLMVRPELRNSSLPVRMAMEAYQMGLHRTVLMDFIDCNRHLEGFFHKLGYRAYCGRRNHDEYGDVLPMVLYTRDWLHLSIVGSPFLKEARKFFPRGESRIDHRAIEPWIERGAA